MPATRRPKKVLVQFAIALVVAVVLGIGAIVAGVAILTGVTNSANSAKADAEKKAAELAEKEQKLEEQARQLTLAPKTYKVVQATANIEPGQPITQDMVTVVSTENHPPMGSLNMLSQVVGKTVKSPIFRDEPVDIGKLVDNDGYLSVKEGMRAITIQVSNIGGLNGALTAGSHVDVLASITKDSSTVSKTLMQNIQVISVGENATGASSAAKKLSVAAASGGGSNGGSAVTLMVTPRQSELLTLANTLGAFHLTLRNFNDKRTDPLMNGADLTQLLTGVQPTLLKKDLPPMPKIPAGLDNSGFHNVNYAPGGGNLPQPNSGGPNGARFSMQIYRGTGTETVDFQQ